ncbi:MAG: hypothetical protein GOV15_01710 [Candidatus Diapherotrites archaeon]|nr:hypothetical protein [Candidatus Diapherotrites archaeon]
MVSLTPPEREEEVVGMYLAKLLPDPKSPNARLYQKHLDALKKLPHIVEFIDNTGKQEDTIHGVCKALELANYGSADWHKEGQFDALQQIKTMINNDFYLSHNGNLKRNETSLTAKAVVDSLTPSIAVETPLINKSLAMELIREHPDFFNQDLMLKARTLIKKAEIQHRGSEFSNQANGTIEAINKYAKYKKFSNKWTSKKWRK